MSDSFVKIGSLATKVLDTVAAERRKRAWIGEMHRRLKIPSNYALTSGGQEKEAPAITPIERGQALSELLSRGVIESTSMDDIIERMCARLGAASNYDYDEPRNRDGSVPADKPRRKGTTAPVLTAAKAEFSCDNRSNDDRRKALTTLKCLASGYTAKGREVPRGIAQEIEAYEAYFEERK